MSHTQLFHTQLCHTAQLFRGWLLCGRRGTYGTGLALVPCLVALWRRGLLRGRRGGAGWYRRDFCVAEWQFRHWAGNSFMNLCNRRLFHTTYFSHNSFPHNSVARNYFMDFCDTQLFHFHINSCTQPVLQSPLSFLPAFAVPLPHLFEVIGRSWHVIHVGLSSPWFFFPQSLSQDLFFRAS